MINKYLENVTFYRRIRKNWFGFFFFYGKKDWGKGGREYSNMRDFNEEE